MRPFRYTRAADVSDALAAVRRGAAARFVAGGTNLIDLMKAGVEAPTHLVDVSRLPLDAVEERDDGGLRLGATALNSDVAHHPAVRTRYPVLTEALVAGASEQIRNRATVAGNLLQRTRCYYFTDPTFAECNKRTPGSGCAAIHGRARIHAILGASPQCMATYPGDMAVALSALDAVVQVRGPDGARSIPIGEFHRLPGDAPHLDTVLRPGELVTAVDVPALSFAHRSRYLKVRDRWSYAFALVSVAAAIDVDDDGVIRDARLALGGVAAKPWRVPAAERVMVGRPAGEGAYEAAADALLAGARPHRDNAFKVDLARRCVVHALAAAVARR
jgi:xanthine dehydrogenase YagS FAD-binding subunit